MAASSGNRAASAITIVCLAPIRAISEPAKRGSVTNGMLPMPRTSPSFVADPVVTRTNQGSANTVIDEPIDDTTSAATIARIGVELNLLIRFAPVQEHPIHFIPRRARIGSRVQRLGDQLRANSSIVPVTTLHFNDLHGERTNSTTANQVALLRARGKTVFGAFPTFEVRNAHSGPKIERLREVLCQPQDFGTHLILQDPRRVVCRRPRERLHCHGPGDRIGDDVTL